MSAAIERASRDTKIIERLAAALEKASSVPEIKDVRDRALAVQHYMRRKQGGLKAAQAAGRIVTAAVLMIAELYHEEESAKNGRAGALSRNNGSAKPGKDAVAEAADMHRSQLNGLTHVIEATDRQRERAMETIEGRGEIVSPAALARELAPPSTPPKLDLLRGRSAADFQAATAAKGAIGRIAEYVADAKVGAILRGCSDDDRTRLVTLAGRVRNWMTDFLEEAT